MQHPFDIAADLDTPVSAFLKLAPLRPRFLLESVEGGERLGRYSFIGFGDCLEFRLDSSDPMPAPSSVSWSQSSAAASASPWDSLALSTAPSTTTGTPTSSARMRAYGRLFIR